MEKLSSLIPKSTALNDLKLLETNPLSLNLERSRRFQRILQIAERYRSKEKVKGIAKDFECHPGTVLRIARLFDIEKRPRGDSYLKKCCVKAYKHGVPIDAIAMACHRSPAWVSKTAGKAGILRRKFKPRKQNGVLQALSTDQQDQT